MYLFADPESELDMQNRQALAVCFKATVISLVQKMSLALSERCGAQGLQEYNQMSRLFVSGVLPNDNLQRTNGL